jgi:hypothetical protein
MFPIVAKRRMAKIMGDRGEFNEIFVNRRSTEATWHIGSV